MFEICWKTLAESGNLNMFIGCATAVLLFILWLLRGRITGVSISRSGGFQLMTGDADLILDLHSQLDPIDQCCQNQIAEHSDMLELIPVTRNSTIHTVFINQLANETLRLSAYANHHTRELELDYHSFCERKLSRIQAKLNRHLWLLKGDKPTNEKIIQFLERWLSHVVLPPVMEACQKKVNYYKSLLMRKNISEHLRINIASWKSKNEKYIKTLTSLITDLQKHKGTLLGLHIDRTSGIYRDEGPNLVATEE